MAISLTESESDRSRSDLETIEVQLLLEGVFQKYGFDFRDYAMASLKRRISGLVNKEGLASVSHLQEKILRDAACMERLLLDLSINVTAMFRDPVFYRTLREKVVPLLRTYPFIRIWHAGCSSGEEAYSMAILLKEENLYDRCRIYATDMSKAVLNRVKSGIFPLTAMKEYTANYHQAGGQRTFSDYYTAEYDGAIFSPALQKNMVIAQHNLVTDGSINEFNLILCRNVLIYFNPKLQERVHELFLNSLCRYGYLGLGHSESLRFCRHEHFFEEVAADSRLYRRV